jgi:hypothetical protein
MLVGKIDENANSYIVKAPASYMLASERAYDAMKTESFDKFNKRNQDSYVSVHLMLDATCKQGKSCVGKIIIAIGQDDVIKQSALKLDTSITKKAAGSAALTADSLEAEAGDGMVYIHSIGTDGFNAARKEGRATGDD